MVEKEHEEIWETPMAYKMLARYVRRALVIIFKIMLWLYSATLFIHVNF